MSKILLTGGAGFIGSHTAVELIQAGFEVVITDDLSNSQVSVIDRIEQITDTRPVFYQIDVADRGALERLFSDHEIDAVIHFAGFKAVGESVKKPLDYYRNNLGTTVALLEAMKKHRVRNIIFSFCLVKSFSQFSASGIPHFQLEEFHIFSRPVSSGIRRYFPV